MQVDKSVNHQAMHATLIVQAENWVSLIPPLRDFPNIIYCAVVTAQYTELCMRGRDYTFSDTYLSSFRAIRMIFSQICAQHFSYIFLNLCSHFSYLIGGVMSPDSLRLCSREKPLFFIQCKLDFLNHKKRWPRFSLSSSNLEDEL